MNYLKSKDLKEYRESQLENQEYICPLCETAISKDVSALDHDHDSGFIRNTLHMNCNSFEGMILHKFKRSGVHKLTDIQTYLYNLLLYWEQDYSNNPIHPNEKPKALKIGKREFNKLNKWYQLEYPRRKPLSYPKTKRWTKVLLRLNKEMEK